MSELSDGIRTGRKGQRGGQKGTVSLDRKGGSRERGRRTSRPSKKASINISNRSKTGVETTVFAQGMKVAPSSLGERYEKRAAFGFGGKMSQENKRRGNCTLKVESCV